MPNGNEPRMHQPELNDLPTSRDDALEPSKASRDLEGVAPPGTLRPTAVEPPCTPVHSFQVSSGRKCGGAEKNSRVQSSYRDACSVAATWNGGFEGLMGQQREQQVLPPF